MPSKSFGNYSRCGDTRPACARDGLNALSGPARTGAGTGPDELSRFFVKTVAFRTQAIAASNPRYETVRLLGRGGMGSVVLARN